MAGDGDGGSAKKHTGKSRIKKGLPEQQNTDFLLTQGQTVALVVFVVLIIGSRFYFAEDGSKKAASDDVLDGQDLYEVLEIKKEASDREVKKAYRNLAVKWHPDKINWETTPGAKITFERITKAYEILSDPMKRGIYDKEQTLMEKSIQSNTLSITTANYNSLVQGQGVWLLQVYVDWSERCQYFSPIWEEVAVRLQGSIGVGRVNLGRDKGLGARLMEKKGIPPSVAVWDGEEEIRRLRWEFHDHTVDGIIKLVALAVQERYKAVVISEPKLFEDFVGKDDRVRVFFIGKANSREQILCTAAAGQVAAGLSIGSTSKMSIGTLAVPNVKPPALVVFRGFFGEKPEVYKGKFEMEAVKEFLDQHKRLVFPLLHRINYPAVCGTQMWCALMLGGASDLRSSPAKSLLAKAVAKVEEEIGTVVAIGGLDKAEQGGAAAFLGGGSALSDGDVVLLERPEHLRQAAGEGVLRVSLVQAAETKDALSISRAMVGVMQGAGGGRRETESALLAALTKPKVDMLKWLAEAFENLSVQTQILIYTVLLFSCLLVFVVFVKPLFSGPRRRLPPPEAGEEEEEEEESEEEDDDGIVLVKKKKN